MKGVTAREFARMCAEHIPSYMLTKAHFPQTEFLDRCVACGLLRRDGNRYFPTSALVRFLPPRDDN